MTYTYPFGEDDDVDTLHEYNENDEVVDQDGFRDDEYVADLPATPETGVMPGLSSVKAVQEATPETVIMPVRSSTKAAPEVQNFLIVPKYYDALLHCQYPQKNSAVYFKAHQLVICPVSKVISGLCEKLEKSSTLPNLGVDADPWTVARLMDFLYTRQYNDDNRKQLPMPIFQVIEATEKQADPNLVEVELGGQADHISSSNHQLLANAKVYKLGQTYDIPGLRELAVSKFRTVVEGLMSEDNPVAYDSRGFADVVSITYEVTKTGEDLELRTALQELAYHHREALCLRDRSMDLDHNVDEFLRDFHCAWASKEKMMSAARAEHIIELENQVQEQQSRLIGLEQQIAALSEEKTQLQQSNRQLLDTQAQMNTVLGTVKRLLHGQATTQCVVSASTQKKRKRGQSGAEALVFQCSCGQTLNVDSPSANGGGLFGKWL